MSLHTTPAARRERSAILRDYKARLPKRVSRAAREAIEGEIERLLSEADALITKLDHFDGDDLEEDRSDFEPSVCEGYMPGFGYVDDIEATYSESEGRGGSIGSDDDDDEPSLAHTLDVNQLQAQKHIGTVYVPGGWISQGEELEAEHDGREPQCEDEGAQCDDEGMVDSDADVTTPTSGTAGLLGCERDMSARAWRWGAQREAR